MTSHKTYFIEGDIDQWVNPSDQLLNQIIEDYEEGRFTAFEEIHGTFLKAINRRHQLEQHCCLWFFTMINSF